MKYSELIQRIKRIGFVQKSTETGDVILYNEKYDSLLAFAGYKIDIPVKKADLEQIRMNFTYKGVMNNSDLNDLLSENVSTTGELNRKIQYLPVDVAEASIKKPRRVIGVVGSVKGRVTHRKVFK
jgi:hypothetical protein